MKKKAGFILLALLCIVAVRMIGSGFTVQTSVYITDDFEVYYNGSEITFTAGVASSMGYIRGKLSPEDTEIYVYHGDQGYDLVLKKYITSGE